MDLNDYGIQYGSTGLQTEKVNYAFQQEANKHDGSVECTGIIFVGDQVLNDGSVPISGDGSGETWNRSPSAIVCTKRDFDTPETAIIKNGREFAAQVRDITIAGARWSGEPIPKGHMPNMAGIEYPTRSRQINVRIHGVGCAVLSEADHQFYDDYDHRGCSAGFKMVSTVESGGQGDIELHHGYLTDQACASFILDDGAVLANAEFLGNGHLGVAPFVFYRPRGRSDKWREPAFAGVDIGHHSLENPCHAVGYDEAHVAYNRNGNWAFTFHTPVEAGLGGSAPWEERGVAAHVEPAKVDPNGNPLSYKPYLFGVGMKWFTPTQGMRVEGDPNLQPGTLVTGVSGTLAVPGSPGDFTLALSKPPLGPVSTVTVGMRNDLAAWEVGTWSAQRIAHAPGVPGKDRVGVRADIITEYCTGDPAYLRTQMIMQPGLRPWATRHDFSEWAIESGGIFVGMPPEAESCSLMARVANEPIRQFDYVEKARFKHVQRARGDGKSKTLGLALHDCNPGQFCVYVNPAFDAFTHVKVAPAPAGATAAQIKALTIPKDGVFKLDPKNWGCVIPARAGSRGIVGKAIAEAIAPGNHEQAEVDIWRS